jgi:hypothetical protein
MEGVRGPVRSGYVDNTAGAAPGLSLSSATES